MLMLYILLKGLYRIKILFISLIVKTIGINVEYRISHQALNLPVLKDVRCMCIRLNLDDLFFFFSFVVNLK